MVVQWWYSDCIVLIQWLYNVVTVKIRSWYSGGTVRYSEQLWYSCGIVLVF